MVERNPLRQAKALLLGTAPNRSGRVLTGAQLARTSTQPSAHLQRVELALNLVPLSVERLTPLEGLSAIALARLLETLLQLGARSVVRSPAIAAVRSPGGGLL
jgi:hypothetical protein